MTAAAFASGASAAWMPATPVSEAGPTAVDPAVGVDAAGNTTVVWGSGDSPSRTIRAAFRPAGGDWEPSEPLISTSDCSSPELAINPSGAAVVVADCGTGSTAMRAAYRPAGGAWESAAPIPASGSGSDPRVALDDGGNAVAVWETGVNVQSAYRPAAGPWGADGQVSPTGDVALDPDVAISPTGRAWVVWRHDLSPSNPVITVEATSRQGAAVWSTTATVLSRPPATSAVPVDIDEPQVVWNRTGDRLAVWVNATNPLPILQSGWGSAGDFGIPWGPYINNGSASDGVRSVEAPQVAIDDQGRAVATWRSVNGSGQFRVQGSATNLLNGSWSTPLTLTGGETGVPAEPSVAVSPAGDATIVWRDLDATTHAVSHPAGGAFGASETIATTSFGNPRVTMDADGDAIAAWADQATGPLRVVVAVDDDTPPVLAVDAPSGAARGAPVSLSASATDAWSEPVALSWDFGDGASATGGAVSHAYEGTGSFTATVTATDAAGNTATAQRSIVVSGPTGSDALNMEVVVPKQSWRKIRKARGVKLRCTLDADGACDAEARVSRKVGKRIGLKGKALSVGTGGGEASAGRVASVKIKLSRAARSAIGDAERNVPLKLTVEGSAPGLTRVTQERKLRIRR